MAVKELAAEADRITEAIMTTCRSWSESEAPDGLRPLKQQVANAQRELRDIKRRLTEEEKSIRLASQQQRAKVAGQGQLIGMFVSSKSRGAIARGRSASRQAIAHREAATLQPYRNVKAAIDRQLNQLQSIKEGIDAELAATKAVKPTSAPKERATSSPAQVPPPPPTPPTWAADPYGRHELRYWDGLAWTHHVSDRGQQAVDEV